MAHVFICYKHNNRGFVDVLRQHLEDAGFEVWMDTNIQGGSEWRAEIDQAIQTAFALIVVMTPTAKKSEYVTYEWSHAIGAGKTVIPIMRQRTELHPRLEAIQYLRFLGNRRDIWPWDDLFDTLNRAKQDSAIYTAPNDAPNVIKQATAALSSHRRDECLEALESLAQIDHPVAAEVLIAAFHHPIRDVRIRTIQLLNGNRFEVLVPELIDMVHDDGIAFDQQNSAAYALDRIGTPEALSAVEEWRQANKTFGELYVEQNMPSEGSAFD